MPLTKLRPLFFFPSISISLLACARCFGWLQKHCFTCVRRLQDFYQIGEASHDGLLMVLLERPEGEGSRLLGASGSEAEGGIVPQCPSKLLPAVLWEIFTKAWRTYFPV